jgi:hypothetical protein
MSAFAAGSRFALNPLIGEAKRRARRRRGLLATALLALLLGVGLAALTSTSRPKAAGSFTGVGTVSDGALEATLPPGWTTSIGQGFYRTHPQAWMLIGDFHLSHRAAQHEGGPKAPTGRVLLTVGDFFAEGPSRSWQAVPSLSMPQALIKSGRWWSVRYAGRALSIKVSFGSAPTPALIHQVQRLLRGFRPIA